MKLLTSETADPNYLATVVTLKNIRPHSDADRLQLVTIFGNQVIVTKDNYEGEKMIYFPIESAINADYLTWANMYSSPTMNADGKTKGYFGDKRRVKATRLRGEISNGIVVPVKKLVEFLNEKYGSISLIYTEADFVEGESFDKIHIYGEVVVTLLEKYIPRITKQGEPREPREKRPKDQGIKSLILPNQFRFHSKTTQLGRAVHTLLPNDIISISSKLHGTSAVFSKVLCKTVVPKWKRWIAGVFGLKLVEQEYTFVYSSRNTIKNRRDGQFTDDVWGEWAEQLETKIPDGFTLYGEIVGYTSNGRMIQSNYHYGETPNNNQFYIYRITYTDRNGEVLEFDWQQIRDFCEKYNLQQVPTYLYCRAYEVFDDLDVELEGWSDRFLAALSEHYLDKPCEICNNGMVREGICLRKENSLHKNAWKLKSFSFLEKESKDRDDGVTNMEEEE